MRRYLAEFLGDPLVVEIPRFLWLPILYGIVLRTRPAKSAEKYKLVWTPEGSPLAVHTARQARLLAEKSGRQGEYAMRYGQPSISTVLQRFSEQPVVVPLFPQFSRSTTETIFRLLPPGVRTVRDFHDHPAYIAALAASLRRHWDAHGRAEKLLMSFHGLPQRAVDRGDPYQQQCLTTARLLSTALGLGKDDSIVTFQSRFGAAKWLQPYTEPALIALARSGLQSVDVICPGFVSDCLETLEEIDIGARHAFVAAGGKRFNYVPCLNEAPEWIAALAEISARAVP